MTTSTAVALFGNFTAISDSTFTQEEILMHPYIEVPFLLVVIIVGVIGNIFIIGATLIEDQILKAGGAFIINLAVADLIVTSWYLPVVLANVFNGYSNVFAQIPWLCYITGFLATWCCEVSLLSMMFVAFNRCWKITRMNMKTKCFKTKLLVFYIFFIWSACFLVALPLVVGWFGRPTATVPALIRFDRQMMACMWYDQVVVEYNIFLVCVAIFVPLLATAYFYISIFIHIRKKRPAPWNEPAPTTVQVSQVSTVARLNDSITVTEGSFCTENANNLKNVPKSKKSRGFRTRSSNRSRGATIRRAEERERKLMLTLVVVVVVFALFWTPYAIMTLLANETTALTKRACGWLALSNSAINSIIYGALNRNFRRGYLKLLKKLCCCCGKSTKKLFPSLVTRKDMFTAKSDNNNP